MAWLFGSKKSSKQPDVYVSNEVEGGFNVVSTYHNQSNTFTPRVSGGSGAFPAQRGQYQPPQGPGYSLYPNIPGQYSQPPYLAVCPPAPPGYKPAPQHPLDSIPFKLSTVLDRSNSSARQTLSELESSRNFLNQVKRKIQSNDYSYSFELERSILREMNT